MLFCLFTSQALLFLIALSFITNVEKENMTLGVAVDEALQVFPSLVPDLKKWAPGDVKYAPVFLFLLLNTLCKGPQSA